MLLRGRIIVGSQLRGECCLQGGALLGWAARNRLDRQVAGFTPLLEVAPDGGERDLKSRSNLGLAMALIHCT